MANCNTVMITNIPAPYREPVHQKVSDGLDGSYHVIYCKQLEANRQWQFDSGNYSSSFLGTKVVSYRDRYIHIDISVWGKLSKLAPDVVITCGFNPVMLIAFLWAKIHRKKHISMTDGWIRSEASLSILHKLVRILVYRFSDAFIGASRHSLDLYRHYRCSEKKLFQSHLCANNEAFFAISAAKKKDYDLMFSGQFIDRKMPLFFAEVACKVCEKRKRCKVLLLGSGPLVDKTISLLEEGRVEVEYPGFIQQHQLPEYYTNARLFLFPTLQEPWGVVANEACAAGTPVITCDNAGAANDLIHNEENGLILPLDVNIWADAIVSLLNDTEQYEAMASKAQQDVKVFNYDNAAKGIINAIHCANEAS